MLSGFVDQACEKYIVKYIVSVDKRGTKEFFFLGGTLLATYVISIVRRFKHGRKVLAFLKIISRY